MIFTLLIGLNLLIIVSVPTDNNHMPYENAKVQASKGHESKMAANIGLFYPHEWRIKGADDDKLTFSVVVSDQNAASVRQYQKKGTKAAVVYTADKDCYIELPIQSYIGYRAYDETGRRLTIERGIGARMRFTVHGDGQEHTINVRYGPHPAFIAANLVSALTIVFIGWRLHQRRRRQISGESGSQESSVLAI